MANPSGKAACFTCSKEKSTFNCRGCSKDYCFTHLKDHRQTLSARFEEIENDRNHCRQILTERKENSRTHPLTEEINKWEYASINLIKQTANQCREILIEHEKRSLDDLENKLTKLSAEIKQTGQENEFNEIDLNQLKIKLMQIAKQLAHPSNILIQRDFTPFIHKISIVESSRKCLN